MAGDFDRTPVPIPRVEAGADDIVGARLIERCFKSLG